MAKYPDHLPLYRQEAIFARACFGIARSTLASWVGVCGVRLQPLVDALKAELLNCAVLHADETPVATLAPGTGKTHRSYAAMSLIQTAKLNGLDPYVYLRDVLTRLPTHKVSRIAESLPHHRASVLAC